MHNLENFRAYFALGVEWVEGQGPVPHIGMPFWLLYSTNWRLSYFHNRSLWQSIFTQGKKQLVNITVESIQLIAASLSSMKWNLLVSIRTRIEKGLKAKISPWTLEPWSTGYGMRLKLRMSWVRIHALHTGWIFFHINLLC